MNILLTNDDGYDAQGIKVLMKTLSKKHNVYVIAPSSNRSAVSSHVTMFNKTEITDISKNVWACSGYPADCVCVGLQSDLIDAKIDVVISGINNGFNLGTDIIYSGTCAAARQGALLGVPSIALSIGSIKDKPSKREDFKFSKLADFALDNLEQLLAVAKLNSSRVFVNVNAGSLDSYKGVKFADELCIRNYNDSIELKTEGECNKTIYHPGAQESFCGENGDYTICQNGFIAISRVYVDPACSKVVDGLKFSL